MANHSRVLLSGAALLLALLSPLSARAQSPTTAQRHVARHSARLQSASAVDSPKMSGQIIETIQNPETSDWEATFILIMGWLTCGLVLFLIFGRKDAERSTAWKICRYLFVIPALFCLGLAFWPITLIYFKGKCRNCHKWGHHARNCPEHFRCWSCGEMGHHARFCPKGPTDKQRWTFIPTTGSYNPSNK